jgi:hypothetical protein
MVKLEVSELKVMDPLSGGKKTTLFGIHPELVVPAAPEGPPIEPLKKDVTPDVPVSPDGNDDPYSPKTKEVIETEAGIVKGPSSVIVALIVSPCETIIEAGLTRLNGKTHWSKWVGPKSIWL